MSELDDNKILQKYKNDGKIEGIKEGKIEGIKDNENSRKIFTNWNSSNAEGRDQKSNDNRFLCDRRKQKI